MARKKRKKEYGRFLEAGQKGRALPEPSSEAASWTAKSKITGFAALLTPKLASGERFLDSLVLYLDGVSKTELDG